MPVELIEADIAVCILQKAVAHKIPDSEACYLVRSLAYRQWAYDRWEVLAMILYSTVGTANLPRAIKFYDAVFGTLGIGRAPDWIEGWAGWGGSYDEGYGFWVCHPFDGRGPTPGNGTMLAFRAKNEAQVQAFHTVALEHGGCDEGAPGTRPYYEPSFYVAYVRDPDGNKLACVYHKHQSDSASN